jgi:hypothetical protein
MARMVSRHGSLGLRYKSLDGVLSGTGRIELRAVLGSGMILKGECKHLCCDRAPEPPLNSLRSWQALITSNLRAFELFAEFIHRNQNHILQ